MASVSAGHSTIFASHRPPLCREHDRSYIGHKGGVIARQAMSWISPYFALVLLALSSAPEILAADYDLRWGANGKGFRRIIHANGICLTGMWEIFEPTPYSGYFRE